MIQISHSVHQTEQIAAELAGSLAAGQCIALEGNLGAGKTQFVRGLVKGLGGLPQSVSSPTYVLLNVYPSGRLTVYHLDAYRTHGEEDFQGIGFEELLEQGGIVVVEWPQRIAGLLPVDTLHIRLTAIGSTTRQIEIIPPPPLPANPQS